MKDPCGVRIDWRHLAFVLNSLGAGRIATAQRRQLPIAHTGLLDYGR